MTSCVAQETRTSTANGVNLKGNLQVKNLEAPYLYLAPSMPFFRPSSTGLAPSQTEKSASAKSLPSAT